MSIILFFYILVLFVLVSPSILFKTHLFLHSLFFVFIFNLTYDLVFIKKEYMRDLEVEKKEIYDHELNISFSNKHTSSPKSNILGQMMIDAFERVAEIKTQINKLQTMIKAYSGTDEELEEIKKLFKETEGKLKQLEEKLIKFNNMKKEVKELTNEINNLEVEKKQLQNKLNKCNHEVANSNIIISNNTTEINKLESLISSTIQKTTQLNSNISSYNSRIPSKTDEIRNKISTCALQYLQNTVSWLQEYI